MLGAAVVLIVAGLSMWRETRLFRTLTGVPFAVAVLGALGALCVVRGLYGVELKAAFAVVWVALVVSLGCLVVKVFAASGLRRWGFLANHVGLWLVFVGAGLGTFDRLELTVKVEEGQTVGMPFEMRLDDFRMETYPDSAMPSYFGSDVTVEGRKATIAVNHPLRHGSWAIYQQGYDAEAGAGSTYSVFLMVRDRWLGMVYAGIALLAVGAISLFLRRKK